MRKITQIALSLAILGLVGCSLPTVTTSEPKTEPQSTKPEPKISFCDEKPTPTEIGRNILPIDPQYKNLGFLGQVFTAYPCGKDRVSQVFGVEGDSYTLGSTIFLKQKASQPFSDILKDLGFFCSDKDVAECIKWSLKATVKIEDLIKLQPFADQITGDDCVNCG